MKRVIISLISVILIIGVSLKVADIIIKSKPPVKRKKTPKNIPTIEIIKAQKTDYSIWVTSRGYITPRTQSTLIPEISGKIIKISSKFRAGSFFEKGDILLEVDPQNYKTAIVISKGDVQKAIRDYETEKVRIKEFETSLTTLTADLDVADLNLKEEEARSKLAERNWKKLGKKGTPGDLVLRKPQLQSAKSHFEAIKAKMEQKKRDIKLHSFHIKTAKSMVTSAKAVLKQKYVELDRTLIKAPYRGRIMEQKVDLGQYVSPGTVLANIYAIDSLEVNLPLTNKQLSFINLPENYLDNSTGKNTHGPKVKITMQQGQEDYIWDGQITRTESSVDLKSQQLFVVAEITDPYLKRGNNIPPLKIGQFVSAKIQAQVLKNVFVLPRSAIRNGNSILIADKKDRLTIRPIHIIWSENDMVVIDSGLFDGEQVCITPLKYIVKNKPVKVNIKNKGDYSADLIKDPD